MEELDVVSIALPAHGDPFTGLAGRARHIIEHHEDRLDTVRGAWDHLADGTVPDFMRVLFQKHPWGDMAESETYAHLEHLRGLGELIRTDTDGVARCTPTH